jgi:hypothetical protein
LLLWRRLCFFCLLAALPWAWQLVRESIVRKFLLEVKDAVSNTSLYVRQLLARASEIGFGWDAPQRWSEALPSIRERELNPVRAGWADTAAQWPSTHFFLALKAIGCCGRTEIPCNYALCEIASR